MAYGTSEQFEAGYYGFESEFDENVGAEVAEFLEDASSAWNDRNKQVASSSLRGALTGFASGGYPGAILGAIGGGMAARSRTAPVPAAAAAVPAAAAPTVSPGATPVTAPLTPSTAEVPNAPALQIIGAMLRPEVFQAFASMAAGQKGTDTVSVGGRQVPVTAIASMIQQLAAQAGSQHRQASAPVPAEAYWPEYSIYGDEDFDEAEGIIVLLAEAAWDEEFEAGEDEYEAEAESYLPEWTQQWPWVPR